MRRNSVTMILTASIKIIRPRTRLPIKACCKHSKRKRSVGSPGVGGRMAAASRNIGKYNQNTHQYEGLTEPFGNDIVNHPDYGLKNSAERSSIFD